MSPLVMDWGQWLTTGTSRTELDALDVGICGLLRQDGRMSTADIARHLRASEPTVRRRLNRLLQENYIRVGALVDPARTPTVQNRSLIGLRVELGAVGTVAEGLAQFSEVSFVGITTGDVDVFCGVSYPSHQALHTFLTQQVGSLAGVLEARTYLPLRTVKYGQFFGPTIQPAVNDRLPVASTSTDGEVGPRLGFDALDIGILNLLSEDGRMATAELARRLGASEPTVRRHLSRLLNEYVHVAAMLDPAKAPAGLTLVLVGLKVDLALIDCVAEQLAEFSEVSFVGITAGDVDIHFAAALPSHFALHEFLTGKLGALPGIREARTHVWLHFLKYGGQLFDSTTQVEQPQRLRSAATSRRAR